MVKKRISSHNVGPIGDIDVCFEKNNNGMPKPVVLVGERAGSGIPDIYQVIKTNDKKTNDKNGKSSGENTRIFDANRISKC